MPIPNKRVLNVAGLIACMGMMAFALFAQHVLLLDPCPLCIFQRVAVIFLGTVFLAAALHNTHGVGRWIYAVLVGFGAGAGLAVAGWHVRLQNLPADEVPSCGPGLDYMVENFPLADALRMVFEGSGECADIAWEFLGLSMPAWVALLLLGLGVSGVWNNSRR